MRSGAGTLYASSCGVTKTADFGAAVGEKAALAASGRVTNSAGVPTGLGSRLESLLGVCERLGVVVVLASVRERGRRMGRRGVVLVDRLSEEEVEEWKRER